MCCLPPAARTPPAGARSCGTLESWLSSLHASAKNTKSRPTERSSAVSNPPQPGQPGAIVLEGKHEGIATLVMNRPDRLNALNNELASALNDALGRIAGDDTVGVVVITGAGRAFCAGGDLGALGKGRQTGATHELEPLLRAGMQMVLKIRKSTRLNSSHSQISYAAFCLKTKTRRGRPPPRRRSRRRSPRRPVAPRPPPAPREGRRWRGCRVRHRPGGRRQPPPPLPTPR